jgi:hypothetical protein
MSRKYFSLDRKAGSFRDIQPLSVVEDADLVSCPWIGFALFHLSGCIFFSSDDADRVSETEQALRLYGVNHGSI